MALITCPECGKEISDKVKACPNCGYPLQEEQSEVAPQQVEVTSINIGIKDPKRRKKLFAGFVVVVVVTFIAIALSFVNKSNKRMEYIQNLNDVRSEMLSGGADAESLCNLAKSVWYNTIYEESDPETDKYTRGVVGFHDDFNVSLSALYADEDTLTAIAEIGVSQDKVAALMDELKKPPEDLSDAYATVTEMYDLYCDFTALAISPSGSLKSFSEQFSTLDNDFIRAYDRLGRQIPEE